MKHAQQRVAHDHARQRLRPGSAKIEISHDRFPTIHARRQSALHVEIEKLDRRIERPHRIRTGLFDFIKRGKDRRGGIARDDCSLRQHRQPGPMRLDQRRKKVPAVEFKDRLEDLLRENRI